MPENNTVTCSSVCHRGFRKRERPIVLWGFWLISVKNMSWSVLYLPTVVASLCLCCLKGCVWQWRSEGLLTIWDYKESRIKMSEAEVIEMGERNYFDLRGELGRLFVFLSNSLHNLYNCWQLYTAWKGLCLYLFNALGSVFCSVCGQFIFC